MFQWMGGVFLWLCMVLPAGADYITLDEKEEFTGPRNGWLPYAFSTDALGTGIGVGAFLSGLHQPQAAMGVSAFVTDNDSWLVVGALRNYRFDAVERWFFDLYLQHSHFTDQRFYDSRDRSRPDSPGSNDSHKDDFLSGVSNDTHFELTARYVLPIGAGRENPLTIFRTREGLLISEPRGGRGWNPMTTGKTILGMRFFLRDRDLKRIDEETARVANTNGLEFWLDYDNTDFLPNPSYGNRQKVTLTSDFDWFNSSNSWTNLELDASWYVNLGTSSWFRHQVLALDFWTSHTPTWDLDGKTGLVTHRPPPGFGSTLGGFDRLRGFPDSRFHDKSAVYYGAELRLIPEGGALDRLPWLKEYFQVDWWQVVAFAEAGRVGPEYDGDLFYKDLKWDVGLSLRVMTFRLPVRLDWAVSDEDYQIWVMYDQPYSR